MIALRIQIDGTVTSFRHPHFIHGVQPTYDMPPPATIYGHVCSALGDQVDPGSFRFALRFSAETRFTDYEHVHLVGR
ncbi:MAG: CRISPR-associated protein Cas5, partial [Anaerolinea sp.]|nr:CRISPR-associated protein Cas5 [Anaerolinea sp.]